MTDLLKRRHRKLMAQERWIEAGFFNLLVHLGEQGVRPPSVSQINWTRAIFMAGAQYSLRLLDEGEDEETLVAEAERFFKARPQKGSRRRKAHVIPFRPRRP